MFKVLFYNYYLFDNMITDEYPYVWAVLHLSAVEGLFVNFIVSTILRKYDIITHNYIGLSITGIALCFNYLYFIKSQRYKEIIKNKPRIFSSHLLSGLIAAMFAVVTFLLYLTAPFFPS